MPITSYPLTDNARSRYLRVRVSETEHTRLREVAARHGLNVSELVRECLPLAEALRPHAERVLNSDRIGSPFDKAEVIVDMDGGLT